MSSRAKVLAVLVALAIAGAIAWFARRPAPAAPPGANTLEARRLLAEAGFPGGRGFPKLTLLYNTSESHKQIASAFQEMWRSGLGIEVELRNMEWKVFLGEIHDGKYEIARRGYFGEYLD